MIFKARHLVAVAVATLLIGFGFGSVRSAPKPPKCCTLTELQQAKMDLQKQITIEAFSNYSQQLNAYTQMAVQYAKDNGWPKDAVFNAQTGQYYTPVPAAASKPKKK